MDNSSHGDKKKKSTPIVKDYINISTEIHIHITVQFEKGKLDELESTIDTYGINGVEKILKLSTTISTTNMNMFNENKQLHKYKNVEEIIDAYYQVRMDTYGKRKMAQVEVLKQRVQELSNRARFIQEIVANTIDLRKYTDDADLDKALMEKHYEKQQNKYDYLTHMPMHNMTKTRVQKIIQEREAIIKELDILQKTSLTTMWLHELDILKSEYSKYKTGREKIMNESIAESSTNTKKITKSKKK
jgi:DNA topoisomerase-2